MASFFNANPEGSFTLSQGFIPDVAGAHYRRIAIVEGEHVRVVQNEIRCVGGVGRLRRRVAAGAHADHERCGDREPRDRGCRPAAAVGSTAGHSRRASFFRLPRAFAAGALEGSKYGRSPRIVTRCPLRSSGQ